MTVGAAQAPRKTGVTEFGEDLLPTFGDALGAPGDHVPLDLEINAGMDSDDSLLHPSGRLGPTWAAEPVGSGLDDPPGVELHRPQGAEIDQHDRDSAR